MAKTIIISDRMYTNLKNLKGNRSFTEFINDLMHKTDVKLGSELKECLGLIRKDNEWKKIKKYIDRGWKNWSKKYA